MLKTVSRTQLVFSWFAAIVVLFAVSVVWGADISVGASELWLLACLAPPAVMLLIWRAPTPTVMELLYAVNQPAKDRRR
jgi:hypothetical protein